MDFRNLFSGSPRVSSSPLGVLLALSLAGQLWAQDIELKVDLSNTQFPKAAWVSFDANCGGNGWDDVPFQGHDNMTLSRECSGVDFDVTVGLTQAGEAAMHFRDTGESLGRDFLKDIGETTPVPLLLRFDSLPPGSYTLESFHNDPEVQWANIPAITVEGDSVTTKKEATEVPQHTFEFDEDVLDNPSVVTFQTDGSGPVEIIYAFPAVLNGFILNGIACPAEKPDPEPDTDCSTIEITGPQDGFAGVYTATVDTTDASGDTPLVYKFSATRVGGKFLTKTTLNGAADFGSTGGPWTIAVEVADLTDLCFTVRDDFCFTRFDVSCPEVGDTTMDCETTTVVGPENEGPGLWTVTIDAEDEGGDEIVYTVNAVSSGGLEQYVTQLGNNVVELNLTPDEWTFTITVDDDDFCEDAKDNVCVKEIEVLCVDPDFPDDPMRIDVGLDQEARGTVEEGWKAYKESARNAGLSIDNIDCVSIRLQVGTTAGNSGFRDEPDAFPCSLVLGDRVHPQIAQNELFTSSPESDINIALEGLFAGFGEPRPPLAKLIFSGFPRCMGERSHTILVSGDVRNVTDSYRESGVERDQVQTFNGVCLTECTAGNPIDLEAEAEEGNIEPTVAEFTVPAVPGTTPGPVFIKLTVNPDALENPEEVVPGGMDFTGFTLEPVQNGSETFFRRGLVNEDSLADISDSITLFGFLFLGDPGFLPCTKAADTNDDGGLDVSDGIFLLAFLFLPGGEIPPAPFTDCGTDLTADALTCESFPLCEAGG